MSRDKGLKSRLKRFLYNHLWLKYILEYLMLFIASTFSALVFVFGFKSFLNPGVEDEFGNPLIVTLVTGGASGFCQDITLIIQLIFGHVDSQKADLIYSILYFTINIPIVILAFKGIGTRFGIFTLVNVMMVSGLVNFVHVDALNKFFAGIATYISDEGGMLSRAIFAGICTGLSSAIAFKFEFSAGGIDVISYYFSLRKSTSVGKYSFAINIVIVGAYAVLNCIDGLAVSSAVGNLCFSVVYIFCAILVIDTINVRNKKVQIQIITSLAELPTMLLANIPHGATVLKGQGAYSKTDKWVVFIDISQSEVKNTVRIIKKLDPNSFVTVTNLQQVYGRFFTKAIK